MANAVAPFGLAPVSHLMGMPWNLTARTYYIPSTDTNAYAIGDPVTLLGTGDGAGVSGCVLATAGTTNTVLGPIVGMGGRVYGGAIGVNPLGNQDSTIIPATKTVGYYVMVSDDPYVIYAVCDGATGTPLAAVDIGLNCSLKAGTNNGYLSTWTLDNATQATTAALQVKLLGLQQFAGGAGGVNAFGLNAIWLVLINQSPFKATVAGL
jgi:hypothetical protein